MRSEIQHMIATLALAIGIACGGGGSEPAPSVPTPPPTQTDSYFRVLHHFSGGANDGSRPLLGRIIQSGTTLYGMTSGGGSNNSGIIFGMNLDGSGFQALHSFVSASVDGSGPYGSLLQSGTDFYGLVASEHDATQRGTLFRMGTDGTGFQVLHHFSGSEGKWPYDTLIQSGSILYGATTYGGSDTGNDWVGGGTLFQLNSDGTNFQVLHTFAGGANDGYEPHGSLIQSGTTLYGTTLVGGGSDLGTIFKINTDGTGFGLLHGFSGGSSDGSAPYGTTLLQSGSVLYGATQFGGSSNGGTIFRINTDGTGFQLLHHFGSESTNGWQPMCGTLVQSGSTLYGMTYGGGAGGNGTIYQIQMDGTGFQLLHSFDGTGGSKPFGSLFLSGSTLCGMTNEGGDHNLGVIFARDLVP